MHEILYITHYLILYPHSYCYQRKCVFLSPSAKVVLKATIISFSCSKQEEVNVALNGTILMINKKYMQFMSITFGINRWYLTFEKETCILAKLYITSAVVCKVKVLGVIQLFLTIFSCACSYSNSRWVVDYGFLDIKVVLI